MNTTVTLGPNDQIIKTLKLWGEDPEQPEWKDIHIVPGWDEDDPTWRARWKKWRERSLKLRIQIVKACRTNPEFRAALAKHWKDDPAFWCYLWLFVEEPRPDALSDDEEWDPVRPFIPFAYQVKVIYLFVEVVRSPKKRDLYITKARGLGCTYCIQAAAFWGWLFRRWRGRFLSDSFKKVERSQDLDSMFGKFDLFMLYLPKWMLPKGFDRGANAKRMRVEAMLKNPVTLAQLTGEAATGVKATRGGRATYTCSDESAFQEYWKKSHGTAEGTTNHRISWSTEHFDVHRDWWNAWNAALKHTPQNVLILEWQNNPLWDEEWLEETRLRAIAANDLASFEIEVLRNPYADVSRYLFPQVHNCRRNTEGYMPERMLYIGIDPGFADFCAMAFWQAHGSSPRIVRWVDAYQHRKQPAEFYAHVLTGIEPVEGDKCWPIWNGVGLDGEQLETPAFNDETLRIMEWMREVDPRLIKAYGDPTSGNKDMSGSTFARRIMVETMRLRHSVGMNYPGIRIWYKELHKRNDYASRLAAIREGLMHSEFADTDGAQQLWEAFAEARQQKPSESRTTPNVPIHDELYSHLWNAAGYGMSYWTIKLTPEDMSEDDQELDNDPSWLPTKPMAGRSGAVEADDGSHEVILPRWVRDRLGGVGMPVDEIGAKR